VERQHYGGSGLGWGEVVASDCEGGDDGEVMGGV